MALNTDRILLTVSLSVFSYSILSQFSISLGLTPIQVSSNSKISSRAVTSSTLVVAEREVSDSYFDVFSSYRLRLGGKLQELDGFSATVSQNFLFLYLRENGINPRGLR